LKLLQARNFIVIQVIAQSRFTE